MPLPLTALCLQITASVGPAVGFETDARPILIGTCAGCHNERLASGALDIQIRSAKPLAAQQRTRRTAANAQNAANAWQAGAATAKDSKNARPDAKPPAVETTGVKKEDR